MKNNIFNFPIKEQILKIHQLFSTYEKKECVNEQFEIFGERPGYSSKKYKINEAHKIHVIFNSIQDFYKSNIYLPIFITVIVNNDKSINPGCYVVDFKEGEIIEIKTDFANNIKKYVKSDLALSFFINVDYIDISGSLLNYLKSCLEIGKLEEKIKSDLLSNNLAKGIKSVFFPTNLFTKIQGIDLTKQLLTETMIIDWS